MFVSYRRQLAANRLKRNQTASNFMSLSQSPASGPRNDEKAASEGEYRRGDRQGGLTHSRRGEEAQEPNTGRS